MTDSKAERNILIFGAVGSGKATVANMLIGESETNQHFPVGSPATSALRDATCKSKEVKTDQTHTARITLIDIYGRRGQSLDSQLKSLSTNVSIPNETHLMLMVIRRETLNIQAMREFNKVFSYFGHLSSITALIVTCCENENMARREDIKCQLKDDVACQKLVNFAKKGIYLVGFPQKESVQNGVWAIIQGHIEKDKKQLQALVRNATEPLPRSQRQSKSEPFFSRRRLLYFIIFCGICVFIITVLRDSSKSPQMSPVKPKIPKDICIPKKRWDA